MKSVIGVDGCPAGWIAVTWGPTVSHKLFHTFNEVLEIKAEVIAVDMPIGLPAGYGREAEKSARKVLGKRKSSIFPIACRSAVICNTYDEACIISRAHSNPPKCPSRQSFAIFPKIREIDALVSPALQSRIHEVHPEVIFWAMNGNVEMRHSKKKPEGQNERKLALLTGNFPLSELLAATYRKSDVADDDLIDACACAWAARRIFEGMAVCFPENPPRDERGLEMCIKA